MTLELILQKSSMLYWISNGLRTHPKLKSMENRIKKFVRWKRDTASHCWSFGLQLMSLCGEWSALGSIKTTRHNSHSSTHKPCWTCRHCMTDRMSGNFRMFKWKSCGVNVLGSDNCDTIIVDCNFYNKEIIITSLIKNKHFRFWKINNKILSTFSQWWVFLFMFDTKVEVINRTENLSCQC